MIRSRSPSVTALRANAGPEAHSACRRGSHRIRWMSSAASATTRESPTRRTRRSMSSISAPTAARRSSTRNPQSRTWSSSRSGRSRTRPSRRRPSRDTTPDDIHGWVCLRRSNASPQRCGGRFSRSTKPASTPKRPTAGGSCSRPIPRTGTCSTTWPAARASPGGGRRGPASRPRDRHVGARQSHGEGRLGLRSDPRRPRVPGTGRLGEAGGAGLPRLRYLPTSDCAASFRFSRASAGRR